MSLNVVSTFSGTGGSSMGYKMAGCNVKACVEFIPEAQESYKANFPSTIMFGRDIRTVTGKEILDAIGMKVGELDVLDGSPPCASFSSCGAGEKMHGKVKSYSGTKQVVDDLFYEYTRLVDEIKPKFFVAENVRGLDFLKYQHIRSKIMNSFAKSGYVAQYELMNAAEYGVPQARERLIFVGVREDIAEKLMGGSDPDVYNGFPRVLHPEKTHNESGCGLSLSGSTMKKFVTVKEALSGIKNDENELKVLFEAVEKYANLKLLAEIKEPGGVHHKRFNLARNHLDRPSRTILQSNGHTGAACVCHPTEMRPHTVAELKKLMSFPDDFIVTGKYSQQHERLGRAVAPVMMKAIAENLIKLKKLVDNNKIAMELYGPL